MTRLFVIMTAIDDISILCQKSPLTGNNNINKFQNLRSSHKILSTHGSEQLGLKMFLHQFQVGIFPILLEQSFRHVLMFRAAITKMVTDNTTSQIRYPPL